jgi:DNA-binding protein H-NS
MLQRLSDLKTMAKTYAQLQTEIDVLRAKAEAARKKESAGVVARMKEAIVAYGLSAEDLGFGRSDGAGGLPSKKAAGAKAPAKPVTKGTKVAVKYRDAAGNTWTGRGSKPRWLAAAMAAGQSLESFAVSEASTKTAKSNPKPAKRAPAAKYRDGNRAWSGFGPKPGWVKEALAAGKTLDDLRG